MFSYNVKFLTNDDSVQVKNGDFKSYKYETKKKADESVYDTAKRSFCERRGGHWSAVKPRQIKQLETKFRERSAVFCDWLNDCLIVIVFSSGAIAYLTVKPNTLDVTQILFDRYVVGKLSGQAVSGVAFCKSHLLFTHTDRTATLLTFGKGMLSAQPCRIRDRDPHIQTVELGGSRRTERRVSWCETPAVTRVLVWGAAAVEPAPWSPVLEDHANMHLYQIKGQQMNLIAYHQLENETLLAEISRNNDNVIHIVEQTVCHKTGVTLSWTQHELPSAALRAARLSPCEAATRAPLPAPGRAARRAPCGRRLLAACIDGSLHIVHATAGLTHSTRLGFVATEVWWCGALLVAGEEGARLQCLDHALAALPHPAGALLLAPHLKEPRRMQLLATRAVQGGPLVLASFTGGPLALLRILHPELMTAWIRSGRPSNAVSLLRAMDWEISGPSCLRAATMLVVGARGAGAAGEARAQAALGTYLAPSANTDARYAPAVHDLARNFFHHLLRRGRYEKALSLCVDLSSWDLCCDARWAARRARLPALAAEAAALAHHTARLPQVESVCSESCSQCSSCSGSDDESSASRGSRARPPPLPRVPLPLLPVPPAPDNPPPATSIRPNLHQYLEKNNTIWNTDVREKKWPSLENVLKQNVEVIPRPLEDKLASVHFRHLFQTELREDAPNMYRYHGNYRPGSAGERAVKFDNGAYERSNRPPGEKNKVKFSDTVTIAVVAAEPPPCPEPARELADSLPLCAPHNYLAAFAPHAPAPAPPPPENAAQKPPKIKVVHFGMV
ncbi:WD repeat-containing and planar cell polarity effector protein fritz [Choristoneura fumiferana]|uniref:WD repeat-containing and planar cell polarity effector protein fritz n=1 Tax=Choristoneura fumiferana TaxID=7141 RepID=UPI003D159C9A